MNKHLTCLLTLLIGLCASTTEVFASSNPLILPMRDRAEVIDKLLSNKIDTVLPQLMRREGIDMWVIVSREYNEDPVIKTMLPATWHAARRRTILVMFDPGEGKKVETIAVSRYKVGERFDIAWDKQEEPDQWKRFAEIVVERKPKKIGINQSEHWGLADGMVATELQLLNDSLPTKYRTRITSAERLAVAWLETRTALEMQIYPQICRIAHEIIAEGFSNRVIQPGVTTSEDVIWWYRDRIRELKLSTWFHPSVDIQRNDADAFNHLTAFSQGHDTNIILPGDLLHVDFGIKYLRLNTDTQQHAYVLMPGETDAPEYLKSALQSANRLQDIFTGNFKPGKTGNEVLKESRAQAISEGIKPSIYTHPLGYHGHAAGTTLGMWDSQEGVPGSGDYPLHLNTAYAIELNAATYIAEWDKEIRIMLEEDAFFSEQGVQYIDGRQKEFILIP
jgi:hypothetical protein